MADERDTRVPEETGELPVEFCPVCGARLQPLKCKAVCARCGYFMSCSEFE